MAYDDTMFIPPWPEWSNNFINAEKWDQFYDKKVFQHPGGHERLPIKIAGCVKEWKRPSEIFGTDGLIIQSNKEDNNDFLNLLVTNKSLLNDKIYRWILYHIMLYATQFKNKWHPSNVVFSCNAELQWNENSKSEYNPFGKYWLKLYFMGKFRMICVSDHLPIDHDNRVLLPLCENNKVLWLPLLVKGLLRIYSCIEQLDQFNTITCLTGWSCIRKNSRNISKEDLWLLILSNSFIKNENSKSKIQNENDSKNEYFPIETIDEAQYYRDKITSEYLNPPNSILIAMTLSPNLTCKNKQIDSMNRYSQPIFLNSVKTIKNKPLESWKKYRWTKWAVENNIIKKHEAADYVKLINIHAPCTSILNQTCHLMRVLNEYKTLEDETQYELDFLYLAPFATYIEFYVKSVQAFPFVKPIFFQNKENPADGSNLRSSFLPNDNNNNSYVYLHFESSHCESMLLTLWVCKDYTIHNGNIEVLDVPLSFNTVDYPFVYVEQFSWYETKLPTPLSSICTRGVSNNLVKFKPGINVLKVWGELPAKYSLMIESTVDFSLHFTVQSIYDKLTNQPKSLTYILAPMKQLFLQLSAEEPNTENHEHKLQMFYSSFIPKRAYTDQENELKKIEKFSIISKRVQTAVLECIIYKLHNDLLTLNNLNGMLKIYTELQDLFQNKLLGQKQISDLDKQIKSYQGEESDAISILRKTIPIKENNLKTKKSKLSYKLSASLSTKSKSTISEVIHNNMFEILCNVLNSGDIKLDEYYLKNDLLNYMDSIIYDENTAKRIDRLLLFRFELNTHSTSKLAPTVIQLSIKTNNCIVNLRLIDNDSQSEVKPMNIDMNLFMVNRTTRGYTLLGWFSDKYPDENQCSYKLSFYGRPYQILHSCETKKDNNFYKYNTLICDNIRTFNFVTKYVQSTFHAPNTDHILARGLLSVVNPAQYTIYCHLENTKDIAMEIRVVDKNNSSTVFASSYVQGKTAMIPAVFLDPNYNTQTYACDVTKKITNTMVFAIEVILIKNTEINYTDNTQNESNNYDWTISCTYDKKITDIILEKDITANFSQLFTCEPHQTNPQQLTVYTLITNIQKSYEPWEFQNSNVTTKIDKNYVLQLKTDYQQIMESMIIKKDTEQTINNDTVKSSKLPIKEENVLNKIFEKQNSTINAIKRSGDLKNESRQNFMDEMSVNIMQLLQVQNKSKINVTSSRTIRKKKNLT